MEAGGLWTLASFQRSTPCPGKLVKDFKQTRAVTRCIHLKCALTFTRRLWSIKHHVALPVSSFVWQLNMMRNSPKTDFTVFIEK